MTKTGIVSIVFGLAAIIVVLLAVAQREMGNPIFIAAAYISTAVVIVGYTLSLAKKLNEGKRRRAERETV